MITQRIRAGDWVYYPTADTKPHRVELSAHGRLYITLKYYSVYFNENGKISEQHNAPSVFIATPASQKQLSEFYHTEFGIPYEPYTIAETLDLLFDEHKYVLLQVENQTHRPHVYAVTHADCPHNPDGSTWVRVLHSNLGDMHVPDTGMMYPIDQSGNRIVSYKPCW